MTEAIRPVLIMRPAVLERKGRKSEAISAIRRADKMNPTKSNKVKVLNLLEMLTGDISCCTEVLVHVDDKGGEDTEKYAETEHDEVTNAHREGRLTAEERFLSLVSIVGGRELSDIHRHGDNVFRRCQVLLAVASRGRIMRTIVQLFSDVVFWDLGS